MLIINADDWGGWRQATDAALPGIQAGQITSVSAMVLMADSQRAAELARDVNVDVGLHINLDLPFTGKVGSAQLQTDHDRIIRFLKTAKYNQFIYNPALKHAFSNVVQMQIDQFIDLYGAPPSHFDSHHHRHLCANMLVDKIIPSSTKVRRNFSFRYGQKSAVNVLYRRCVDWYLKRRYRMTDYFFSLFSCLESNRLAEVANLAISQSVELMTHPSVGVERDFLKSNQFQRVFDGITLCSYREL